MIRLLALDIDGTLLDSNGRVPSANVEAVARAIEAGVTVVLATGRRFDFARPIFEQLPAPLTLILSNGAVVKTVEGKTVVRHLLPRDVARDVLLRLPEHRDGAAVVFDRPHAGQVVFEAVDWEHPRHGRFFAANRPYLSEVVPLEACLIEDPVQVMFSGACAGMREVFEYLQADPPSPRLSEDARDSGGARAPEGQPRRYEVALTEYEHRDFSLVDVIRAGCSKGAALGELAAQLGIPAREVMAVGDNLNDLPMLEFAGRPVLMANALPELRTRDWHVTASNDDAGVALAIETFVLREASK